MKTILRLCGALRCVAALATEAERQWTDSGLTAHELGAWLREPQSSS